MTAAVNFTVFGNPIPKARARTVRTKNGRTVSFTPAETEMWENTIYTSALPHRPAKLLEGALILEATFYFCPPKNRPKNRVHPSVRPDLDNLTKAVCDALHGVIYANDSQIVEEHTKKRYDTTPRIEIVIREA
ncbi:MAG: RusA family crossover junction endodeoxyribonuclease [Dehalococcoidia bacterium]